MSKTEVLSAFEDPDCDNPPHATAMVCKLCLDGLKIEGGASDGANDGTAEPDVPPPADDQPPKTQAEIDALFQAAPSQNTCAAGAHCGMTANHSTLASSHTCTCCEGKFHSVLKCGSFFKDIEGVSPWMLPSRLREKRIGYRNDEEGKGLLQICGMCVFKLNQLVMRHSNATKQRPNDESDEDEDQEGITPLSDEQVAEIAVSTDDFIKALQEVPKLKQPTVKQREKGVGPKYVYREIEKVANALWNSLKVALPPACQKQNATRAKLGIGCTSLTKSHLEYCPARPACSCPLDSAMPSRGSATLTMETTPSSSVTVTATALYLTERSSLLLQTRVDESVRKHECSLFKLKRRRANKAWTVLLAWPESS